MEKEKIIYRVLERDEIRKLNEIDRYEIVEEVYYFREGKLVLEKEYREFIDISDISEVIEDYIALSLIVVHNLISKQLEYWAV